MQFFIMRLWKLTTYQTKLRLRDAQYTAWQQVAQVFMAVDFNAFETMACDLVLDRA